MVNLLLLYWGRKGGGVRYTCDLLHAPLEKLGINVFGSFSRNSDLVGELLTKRSGHLHFVSTYDDLWSAIPASLTLPFKIASLLSFIRARKIDCVLVTMRHPWSPILNHALRLWGVPVIHCVHDAVAHAGDEYPGWKLLTKLELRAAARLLTFSEFVAKQIVQEHDIRPEKISVSKLPVFRYQRDGGRQKGDGLRFLFFGRMLPYKGLDLLLEAFRAFDAPEATLSIIGPGAVPADLLDLIEADPRITYRPGWVPEAEVPAVLAAHDVVVLPYRAASQSGVVMTAYGAGKPVIVTPAGGVVEQVLDGQTGLIAADISSHALLQAMRQLVERPGRLQALAEGVRAYNKSDVGTTGRLEELARLVHEAADKTRCTVTVEPLRKVL